MTRRADAITAGPPDWLTVDELAAVLRISRNNAYKEVRRGVATGGREGVPAVRIDKQFRVSRYVLEELLGGPITWPLPAPVAVEPRVAKQPTTRSSRSTTRPKRAVASRSTAQLSLAIES